jgi:heme-degrading monooxygenase HmoA
VAEQQEAQHAISLFRFRMRDLTPAQREDYNTIADRLMKIATGMPGFVSFRNYAGEDGEMLLMVEFASAETLAAWRVHPDHLVAQQRGREEFYADFQVTTCAVMYKYGNKHA